MVFQNYTKSDEILLYYIQPTSRLVAKGEIAFEIQIPPETAVKIDQTKGPTCEHKNLNTGVKSCKLKTYSESN